MHHYRTVGHKGQDDGHVCSPLRLEGGKNRNVSLLHEMGFAA